MSEQEVPLAAKWPFVLGDLTLLAAAGGVAFLAHSGRSPWSLSVAAVITGAVGAGAWILVTPFLRDQEAELRLSEQANLSDTLRQIQNLEKVASSVATSAASIQSGQQALQRAEVAAGAVATLMESEKKVFLESLHRFQDQEKGTLKLEIEKLRRGEEETLRVICHLLDHNFAVYQAGQRSTQPGVAQQLATYRAACLDAVRRVGIVAHEARPGEAFNPDFHQTLDGKAPPTEAQIAGTLACGYTIRGQVVRPIIVSVDGPNQATPSLPVHGSAPEFDSAPSAASTEADPVSPPAGSQ